MMMMAIKAPTVAPGVRILPTEDYATGVPVSSGPFWFDIALIIGALIPFVVVFLASIWVIAGIIDHINRIHLSEGCWRFVVITTAMLVSLAIVGSGYKALSSMEDRRVERSNVAALEAHYGISDVRAKTPILPTNSGFVDETVSFRDGSGARRTARIVAFTDRMYLEDSSGSEEYGHDSVSPYDYGTENAKAPPTRSDVGGR